MSHTLPRRAVLTGGAVFVVSDAVTFVALLAAAASLRHQRLEWPISTADWRLLGVLTIMLFSCSLLLGLARRAPAALWGVALLGIGFVAGEAMEWRALVHAHLGPATDLRHAALFVITGLHGAHVIVGSLYAARLAVAGIARRTTPDVSVLALYWAALDLAWVAICLIVYR